MNTKFSYYPLLFIIHFSSSFFCSVKFYEIALNEISITTVSVYKRSQVLYMDFHLMANVNSSFQTKECIQQKNEALKKQTHKGIYTQKQVHYSIFYNGLENLFILMKRKRWNESVFLYNKRLLRFYCRLLPFLLTLYVCVDVCAIINFCEL